MTAIMHPYTTPNGTLPLLTGVLEALHFMHRDMVSIVQDLPPDALHWKPGADMGTLAGIVQHTLYCETYALRRATGEAVEYDPAADKGAWDVTTDADTLVAAIVNADVVAKRALPSLTVARMGMSYTAWGGGETVAGVLIQEGVYHTAMHWGHMQMTRQLWGQHHPEFVGTYKPW